jgi:hypothetical protein
MNKLTVEQSIEMLGNNQAFLVFLGHIHSLREQEIKSLRNASKDDIMRVAGRVDAFDEVLDQGKYEGVMARFEALSR